MVPLEVDSSSNPVPSIADGQNDEHNTVRLWGEGWATRVLAGGLKPTQHLDARQLRPSSHV